MSPSSLVVVSRSVTSPPYSSAIRVTWKAALPTSSASSETLPLAMIFWSTALSGALWLSAAGR